MEFELIISFLGASMLLTIMPGPDNIFVLTESLTKGAKNGVAVSAGLSLGVLVHTTAAATGLSIIIQQSALAFSIVKYAGAAYLFYLAYKAIQEKKGEIVLGKEGAEIHTNVCSLVKTGFLMNVMNPKVALFFIAFLPQFVTKTGFHMVFQMILLGVLFMLQAFIIFSLIALLSGKLSSAVNNPGFWSITKWSKVGVLTGLGFVLFFSRK